MDTYQVDPATGDGDVAMVRFNHQLEINHTLTTLYLVVEVARWEATEGHDSDVRQRISRTLQSALRGSANVPLFS